MPVDVMGQSDIESGEISVVVIRCGCGEPERHPGQVCPKGIKVELGTAAAYYRNPVKQLLFNWGLKWRRFLRDKLGALGRKPHHLYGDAQKPLTRQEHSG